MSHREYPRKGQPRRFSAGASPQQRERITQLRHELDLEGRASVLTLSAIQANAEIQRLAARKKA